MMLAPVRTAPSTTTTPAPTAVLRSLVDMLEQPAKFLKRLPRYLARVFDEFSYKPPYLKY